MIPPYPEDVTVLVASDDARLTVVRSRLVPAEEEAPSILGEPLRDPFVDVKVRPHSVEIHVEGYEDHGAAPGWGDVVMLERGPLGLTLYVWDDINSEDPSHVITLEGARAENLRPENKVRPQAEPD